MPLTLAGEMDQESYDQLPEWVRLLTEEAISILTPEDLVLLRRSVWKEKTRRDRGGSGD